jgi:F-type H+-transporting ATPase subunit epsilon
LLPRHIDFVAVLAPGLVAFETPAGQEEFLAIDYGILVKKEADVFVSTTDAALGPDLGQLRQTIAERFHNLDERERHARSALARLEAEFMRRFIELRE